MIVSSGTVSQWAEHFANTQGSDRFSQEVRELATKILAQLDHPAVTVKIPFRMGPWVNSVEALAWLKQVEVVVL
jgi:hypothetical protein